MNNHVFKHRKQLLTLDFDIYIKLYQITFNLLSSMFHDKIPKKSSLLRQNLMSSMFESNIYLFIFKYHLSNIYTKNNLSK